MKRIARLPVRVVRITRADGTPCPEDDWRMRFSGTMGTLGIYESGRFPGKVAGCFSSAVTRDRCRFRTSVGDLSCSDARIAITTASGVYEFEELREMALAEYRALVSTGLPPRTRRFLSDGRGRQ